MRKETIIIAVILSLSLFLASCAYEGYEFEIDELSYTPPVKATDSGTQDIQDDDDFSDQDSDTDETQTSTGSGGGGRSRPAQGSLEGTLEVNVVNVPNAIIKIDGETIGEGQIIHLLNPGTYLLEVQAQGYAAYVSNVIINPRSERQFSIRLYPEWLPSEERISIESFSSNQNHLKKGETLIISSLFSGPPDVVCNIIIDGREQNTLTERNSEHLTSHAFQNAGRKEIELKCSGMVGEQSQIIRINVHECITDDDCPFNCINNVCVQEFTEKIDLQIEYFQRVFLWFGRWKEYDGAELKPRTRVRMTVNELPENENCTPIGTSINIQENSRSKPIILTNPVQMGIVCDNGQEEIIDVNVRVEGGIIGELIE